MSVDLLLHRHSSSVVPVQKAKKKTHHMCGNMPARPPAPSIAPSRVQSRPVAPSRAQSRPVAPSLVQSRPVAPSRAQSCPVAPSRAQSRPVAPSRAQSRPVAQKKVALPFSRTRAIIHARVSIQVLLTRIGSCTRGHSLKDTRN